MSATSPNNSTAPGQSMRVVQDDAIYNPPLRFVRFDAEGSVMITGVDGNKTPALAVVAGEWFRDVNIVAIDLTGYTGAVVGWT